MFFTKKRVFLLGGTILMLSSLIFLLYSSEYSYVNDVTRSPQKYDVITIRDVGEYGTDKTDALVLQTSKEGVLVRDEDRYGYRVTKFYPNTSQFIVQGEGTFYHKVGNVLGTWFMTMIVVLNILLILAFGISFVAEMWWAIQNWE